MIIVITVITVITGEQVISIHFKPCASRNILSAALHDLSLACTTARVHENSIPFEEWLLQVTGITGVEFTRAAGITGVTQWY